MLSMKYLITLNSLVFLVKIYEYFFHKTFAQRKLSFKDHGNDLIHCKEDDAIMESKTN